MRQEKTYNLEISGRRFAVPLVISDEETDIGKARAVEMQEKKRLVVFARYKTDTGNRYFEFVMTNEAFEDIDFFDAYVSSRIGKDIAKNLIGADL